MVALLGRLKRKGYHIFLDNLYNSINLSRYVFRKFSSYITGTYRVNYGIPDILRAALPTLANEVSTIIARAGLLTLVLHAIKDNRLFYMLSSWPFPIEWIINRTGKPKLLMVDAYNSFKVLFVLFE